MNFAAFERAQVAAFAYREARFTGSLDSMRAVCYVLRNRVKSAWGDGSWLAVMEAAHLTAATNDRGAELSTGNGLPGNSGLSSDRLLQSIVRDVDDIYLMQESFDDAVAQVTVARKSGISGDTWKPALYYSFVDRPVRPWFVENIIRRADEHPQIGQIGAMMLYR
jgi:hypothetical protein